MKVPRLPAGFQIEEYLGGYCLTMQGRMIACSSPVDGGGQRLTVKIGTPNPRTVFVGSDQAAKVYMTRWCFKWEREIGEAYRGISGYV